ncbi:hypothetical protein [Thermodesulfatator autotrophicus]|uniref:Uncharacterized protein n=1 Tax=Thermodesulfatator autotrophicus TaxID=1795632 RepID=A0A177E6L6_9BACT|nr:hypothetical protein [Thermodesulfatator autotrophicus]OAG26659.1 hypothetical protein TH606_11230 [Thermodesulfatator autotrophicus]
MNLSVQIKDIGYSISRQIVTVTITISLVDLDQTDADGNPFVLDEKTVSISQNMLSSTALDELNAKIYQEIRTYFERAKVNIERLTSVFGTINTQTILNNLKTNIETNMIPNAINEVFGGS